MLTEAGLMNGYILISLLWLSYFCLHSLLAGNAIKQKLRNFKGYRLAYSLIATMLLVPILWLLATRQSPLLFVKSPLTDFAGLASAAYGVMVIRMSFRHYGWKEFIGLNPEKEKPLQTGGILGRIRHPIYAGTILLVAGFVLYVPRAYNLLSACWIFLYLPIGMWLEERKLLPKFGQQYEGYRKKVPAIFPRLFSKK